MGTVLRARAPWGQEEGQGLLGSCELSPLREGNGACCAVTPHLSPSQGVHESRGVTKDYLRLETLIQKVVSPYLGTYGLYSSEGSFTHSCILGRGHLGLGQERVTTGPIHLCPGPRLGARPWSVTWGPSFKG